MFDPKGMSHCADAAHRLGTAAFMMKIRIAVGNSLRLLRTPPTHVLSRSLDAQPADWAGPQSLLFTQTYPALRAAVAASGALKPQSIDTKDLFHHTIFPLVWSSSTDDQFFSRCQ